MPLKDDEPQPEMGASSRSQGSVSNPPVAVAAGAGQASTSAPKPDRLRFGRFERRLLAAMAAVAFLPAIAALLLGRAALRDVYELGVNERVLEALDRSLDDRHAHLESLRAGAQRTATMVAHDAALADALRADPSGAAARTVLATDLVTLSELRSVSVRDAAGQEIASVSREVDMFAEQTLDEDRPIVVDGRDYVVTVGLHTSRAPFEEYVAANETVEVYRALQHDASYYQSFYLIAYITLLLAAIVVVLAAGIVSARRVTRRVTVLADATQKVGRGDLTIEIPTDDADEVGELVGAFNEMVRDIKSSRDRIEYLQRIGAWQEIARRLAHEIKNPLTPIQLAVQEVHRKYEGADPRFQKTLDDAKGIVEEEVETLRRLVSEFSGFARLPVPVLAEGELSALATEWTRTMDPAALTFEGGASGASVALEVRTDGELPVMIDAQMVRRCVDNLVRNAVQAITSGGGAGGRVIVETRRDDGDAVLEVRDDGPGVPEAMRERVFDPYYTTKSEGTGLGLAIVKKIVLEHGGSIACTASPEGGATFRIRLPLRPSRSMSERS